jgi:hypothetical protein
VLCAPLLSYVKNGKIYKSSYVVDSQAFFETKKFPNGSILVKEGPRVFYSYYGSGQCGACPRALLNMYSINTESGDISQLFHYEGVTQSESNDIDIHLSEDWNTVTVFDERSSYDMEKKTENNRWVTTEYCFNKVERSYKQCGKKDPSPPPPYRVLKYEY